MKLSVCIPTFDPSQKYSAQLFQLLNSIKLQTMKPDEVVITANHDLSYLDDLKAIVNGDYELVFKRNESNGSAENHNHAISLCRGEFVKIMHQDDFLVNNNALNLAYSSLNKSKKMWRASGRDHFFESTSLVQGKAKPKLTRGIINGVNKIGPPSVFTFKRTAFVPFDEEMKYMFDCDWYLKMWHNFGKPLVAKDVEVRIRIHEGQATNWAENLLKQEIVATKQNHNKIPVMKKKCSCVIH